MTEDEEKVWQEAIAGVKRIKSDVVVGEKKPKKHKTSEVSIPFVSRDGFSKDLSISDFSNVDGAMARRIKRNKFEVEAKLDLHGYTVDKAYEAVRNFLFKSYNEEKRCVLIVTGKGYKKEKDDDIFSSRGVLREKVPEWLNSFDVRPLILSVSNPDEKMGGSGALYIILRRHRK